MSQKPAWNDHSSFDQEQFRRRWDYSMNGLDQGSPMGIDSGNMVGGGASQGSQQEPFLPLADHSPGSSMADNPGQVLDWSSPPVSKDTYKYEDEPAPKPADAEAMAKAVLRGQVKRWEWTYSSTLLNGEISSRYRDDSQSSVFCCQRLPYICNVDGVCVIDRKECQEFCSCASNPYTPHCTKDVIPRIKKKMTALEDKILEKVSKELNMTPPPTLATTPLLDDPTTTEFIYVRRSTYRPATSNRSLTVTRVTPTPLSNYDATPTPSLKNNFVPPQRHPSIKSNTTTPKPASARSTTVKSRSTNRLQPKPSSSVAPTKSSTSSRTTQGSTSSRTTQGSTSSHSTQGSTSSRSTQGSTSSRSTQGSTSNRTIQGSTSSRTTQGSTSSRSTQGSTSSRTTQGSTSSRSTQGSTLSRSTQGSTSNRTTQGSISNRSTQGSTSSRTTQGSTSSRTTQGSTQTSSSNLSRTSIQVTSKASPPIPSTTAAYTTKKTQTTAQKLHSSTYLNASFANGTIRRTASPSTNDTNSGSLQTVPTITPPSSINTTAVNSSFTSNSFTTRNANTSTSSNQDPTTNASAAVYFKTSTSTPVAPNTSGSHAILNVSATHTSTAIRDDPATSTTNSSITATSLTKELATSATIITIKSSTEPLTTRNSNNSSEISYEMQSTGLNSTTTEGAVERNSTRSESTISASPETTERSFGKERTYGNLSHLMVSTTSVGDDLNRTVIWSDVNPAPHPSQDESNLVDGGRERDLNEDWMNSNNVDIDYCKQFPCKNGSCWQRDTGGLVCNCSIGWTGEFCDMPCSLDCGQHGHCGRVGKNMTDCICHQNYTGHRCQEKRTYVTAVTEVSVNMNKLKVWEVALIAIMTAACAAMVLVAMPYLLWRRQWIPIRQLVFYFQEYEDDDDKDYDAFVSYQSSPRDERFILQHLYPKLEKELQYRLCLHFRDFSPGEPIANNIIRAIEQSRRTILILSPRYVSSEWCRMEYQKAQHEMLRLKHKIIPIVLEDISGMPEMDANLKTIIDTVTYIQWPGEEEPSTSKKVERFWKLLELAMPKKKDTLARSLSSCSSDVPLTSVSKSCFDSIASSLKDFDELSATSLSSSSSACSKGSSATSTSSERAESATGGSRSQFISEAKLSHGSSVAGSSSAPSKKESDGAEDSSFTKSRRSSDINSEQTQTSSSQSAVSSRTKQLPLEHSLTPPTTSIAPRKTSLPSSAASSIPPGTGTGPAQEKRRTSDQNGASFTDQKVTSPPLLGASCPAVKNSPTPRFSSDDYIIEVKEIGNQIKISNRPPRKFASEILV